MHADIRAHFQALVEAVQGTAIPAERKEVVAGSVQRLSSLYAKFRETNESRYGAEIASLVQGILKDLEACPKARKLDAPFREKLRRLHDELGVPSLALKSAAPPSGPKMTRTKR